MSEILARAVGLTKHYGPTVALDGVDLDVTAGELVGLRHPTAGRAELFGRAPTDAAARQRLGTTPQETGLPPTLRVTEVIEFVGRHFPDPLGVGELLERFGLEGTERSAPATASSCSPRTATSWCARWSAAALRSPTCGWRPRHSRKPSSRSPAPLSPRRHRHHEGIGVSP